MKRLIVYAEECAGCRQCEMVCSFKHEQIFSPELSRVTVIKDDRNGLDYPMTCRNCSSCPPQENCPVGAINITSQGVVETDWSLCIGCGLCVDQCKYGAIKLNREQKPIICDHCGGDPECVKRCPTNAIRYEESPEFTETVVDAFNRMKEEWGFNE